MRFTICFLLVLMLGACNSDIFVDDFKPVDSEIVLDGSGDSYTIHFGSNDWTTLSLNSLLGGVSSDDMIVTPLGGESGTGSVLQGDGSIVLHTELTYITVTRRGANVTVDVHYAIGNSVLPLWLSASSDDTGVIYYIDMYINRSDGLEITDVDYDFSSWFTWPVESFTVASHSVAMDADDVTWTPELPGGISSLYIMSTSSDDGELLNALIGTDIPIPTRTVAKGFNWALRGETAPVRTQLSATRLMHYPPLPTVDIRSGTAVWVVAGMEPCAFYVRLKVKNKFVGTEKVVSAEIKIYEPEDYVVIRRSL